MKYEIEIDDVAPIVVQDLIFLYHCVESEKERKALRRVIRMYLTPREFEDWEATGVYA